MRARSIPRVGSSSATRPGSSLAFHPPSEGDRQGQPLPLAAGEIARVGVDRVLQPDDPQGRQSLLARQLVADPLADQVVARVLGQQRDPARCLDLAAYRGRPGRRPSSAGCSCRRRCGPSGRPARRVRRGGRFPAGHRGGSSPGDSSTHRLRAAGLELERVGPPLHLTFSGGAWPAGRGRSPEKHKTFARGSDPLHRLRSVDARIVARVADSDGQGLDAGEGEEARGGVVRAGSESWAQARKSPGGPSKAIAPDVIATTRSAAARQRSRRCSARSAV